MNTDQLFFRTPMNGINPCKDGKHKMISFRRYPQKVKFTNKHNIEMIGFRNISVSRCQDCGIVEDFIVLER